MNTSAMVYDDISLVQVKVTVGKKEYVLQEADADTARRYRNMAVSGAKMDDGKVIGVRGIGDLELFLVGECLFEASETQGTPSLGRKVDAKTLQSWKSYIISDIFRRAKEISRLDEPLTLDDALRQREKLDQTIQQLEEGDAAKKQQSGTPDGSAPQLTSD